MRTFSLNMVLCFTIVAGIATAQTMAFQNDFEHDTPGSAPAASPPGEPDADSVVLRTQGGPITVQDSWGGMSGHVLLMNRTDPGYFSVEARLDPDMWNCDNYTIRWRSACRNNVFFFACSAYAPNSQLLAGVEYREGYHLSFNGGGEVAGGFQIDVPQAFQITLDMVAKTTSLSVDGVAIPGMQDIPQYQLLGDGLKTFFFKPGGVDDQQFVIDDIEITSDCGGTANESKSWGAVKSLYN